MQHASLFWWESITGPQRLIERMSQVLREGRSVVLQREHPLPWLYDMRDVLCKSLYQAQMQPLYYTAAQRREDIIPAVLGALRSAHALRCPDSYDSQLKFLRSSGAMAGIVLWLDLPEDAERSLEIRFLSDYRGDDLSGKGAFILEATAAQLAAVRNPSKCVEVLCYDDFIHAEDVRLFATNLANRSERIPNRLRAFSANVCTGLGQHQVELIPAMLDSIDFASENPADAASRMFPGMLGLTSDEMTHCVWTAQLQTAFASIEILRLTLVSRYAEAIQYALDHQYWDPKNGHTGVIEQFGVHPDSPDEVELGTLTYMMNVRRADQRDIALLVIPCEENRRLIFFLKECRNKLAHHQLCTPAEFLRLLNSF